MYKIKILFNKIITCSKIKIKYFIVYVLFKLGMINHKAIELYSNRLKGWGKTTLLIKVSSKFNYPIIVDTFEQKNLTEEYAKKLMDNKIIKKLPIVWAINPNMSGYANDCKFLLDCSSIRWINSTIGYFEFNGKVVGGFIQH